MRLLQDERAQVRTVWLLCTLVIGIGVGCVWWPGSQRLDLTRAQANELYEEANQNEVEVKRGALLIAARSSLLADVADLRGQSSGTAATAVAISTISDEAKHFQIEVRSLIPEPDPLSSAGLERTGVALAVRGHFRKVVAFVGDLPRHAALIGIDGINLGGATVSVTDPSLLDVTIHLSLYRLKSTVLKETFHASGAS